MAWIRLDDKRAMNRKLRKAGFAARGLDEAAICTCAHDETDGFISDEVLGDLGVMHGATRSAVVKLANVLVGVGRWTRDDERGGYHVGGYLEFNPSRAELEARREADRRRKRKRSGLHDDSGRNPHGTAADSETPSRPSRPDRPVPTDRPERETPPTPRTAGGEASTPRSRGESPRQVAADRQRREERLRGARNLGESRAVVHATEEELLEDIGRQLSDTEELETALGAWRDTRKALADA